MRNLKTREASERLGVSQTTVKRWASHYPSSFRKDPLGHYVFSQREFGLLQSIKAGIEQGHTLEQIALPPAETPASPAVYPSEEAAEKRRELQLRLSEIERSLDQKADEVVSAQVRQHRAELDELRRVVAQLAAAVETLESRAAAMVETARNEELRLPNVQPVVLPERKKKLFRTFF